MLDSWASVFELLHQAMYYMNGTGEYTMDALSTHFEAMCDSVIAILLLLVGSGWTL
eukprot:CAMPEP_0118719260 /NCGR_PEP_ID=MMETSP0800-20121206/29355_1 /TAXON_ID=210618 ORGANISM="Striatella unipunctata, Strain CCMP2910" /NCGR_SAMPLE_ID=MMETSP0800 /ASSEMBLY_ACC=CAM_ASM_000638 /LENGTH=55 /DNA_ID=CAMNT_0006626567 /DNA_START=91 /DNA_END=254 /DNA_ORIENTATION=+